MKSIKNIITMFIISGTLVMTSCTDLDIEPEGNYITAQQKKDLIDHYPQLADGDILGMYRRFASPGTVLGNTAYNGEAYPDDGGYPLICLMFDLNGPDATSLNVGYNWFSTSCEYSDRNANFRNPQLRWFLFYQQIKAANDILSTIDKTSISSETKAMRGQALAIRAFDYLNLAPYYQFKYKGNEEKLCVPIVTENAAGNKFPRNTVKDVYKQIIDDLNEAIDDLNGYTRDTKAYINQGVAYGLRARANLYMENWEEAASDAAKAIELCSSYADCDGLPYSIDEVSRPAFCTLEDHNWMWGIKMNGSQINGSSASWPCWICSFSGSAYTTYSQIYYMINKLLYDKISDTDVRKGWWVDENLHSNNLANVTWNNTFGDDVAKLKINGIKEPFLPYTNVKFAQQDGCGDTKNGGDWCLMRVEEMILIQAEAYAKAGNETRGKEILESFIKTYRDPNYKQSCSKFDDEVWKQRRIELWGEGFAMSDIMRLGKPVVRFHENIKTNVNENFQFNIASNDEYLLLRIPNVEIETNSAIIQNTGGNAPSFGQNGNLYDGVTD